VRRRGGEEEELGLTGNRGGIVGIVDGREVERCVGGCQDLVKEIWLT
jgi:hypothetical protein